MKIPELLAPAGNFEILKAAADAGADAVYFGGEVYGARAFAGNLSRTEVLEAIEYLHSLGKKAYLTVNTLLKNREIEEGLFSYLRDFYEAGLDAVLIQDWGVLSFVKAAFPDLTCHASTQMCVSSPCGYEFLKAHGIARAVPARELSLDEIRALCAVPGIETEVFVHGAMCVCYSGRCYLSGMIGGRSANRGRCGQPCRLPYEGYIDNKKAGLPDSGRYPISMKDLCGLPVLKELCETGVDSLKIEGRMKAKEYVEGVVSVYRKYLDCLAENQDGPFSVEPSDMDFLRALGNRGNFAHTYYRKKNGAEMISFSDSSFHSDRTALAPARAASSPAKMQAAADIPVDFTFSAAAGEPMRLAASAVLPGGDRIFAGAVSDIVEAAEKKATTEDEVRDKLVKLGGTGFVPGEISITLDENIFLPMSRVNALRREVVEKLKVSAGEPSRCAPACAHPAMSTELQSPRARKPACPPEGFFSKTEEALRRLKEETRFSASFGDGPDLYISVMDLGQLSGLCSLKRPVNLIIPAFLFLKEEAVELLSAEKAKGLKVCLSLPYVFRKRLLPFEKELEEKAKKTGVDGYFVSQVDSLQYLLDKGISAEDIFGDNDLYVFNRPAMAFYADMGIRRFSAPFELNGGELSHLLPEASILTVYGRVPVMKTANCLLKNTGKCEEGLLRKADRHTLSYTDRKGASVPVVRDCMNCINVMYNSVPSSLLSDLPEIGKALYGGYRLDFTTETGDEIREILSVFEKTYVGERASLPGERTRGHYKRGVE